MVTKKRIAISLVLTIPVALTIFILKKPQQDSIPKELAIPTVLNKSSPAADRLTSPSKEEIEQRSNTSGVTPLLLHPISSTILPWIQVSRKSCFKNCECLLSMILLQIAL